MKIAVTYENGEVFQHFGHTEQFKIYHVEEGKIVSSEVVNTNGSGHGALAGFLKELGAEVLSAEVLAEAQEMHWQKREFACSREHAETQTHRWKHIWEEH